MVQDKEDLRLIQLVSGACTPQTRVTLQGYPDDEGIRVNQGRPGASLGPKVIREILFKMTPEAQWSVHKSFIFDAGDLVVEGKDLVRKQTEARQKVTEHLKIPNNFLVSLGGGHDYGFPDVAGFMDVHAKQKSKPLVINFDAHMDVRPQGNGPHSGTPFRQVVEEFGSQMELIEVGIQPQCNSSTHLKWARDHQVKILTIDEIRISSLLQLLKKTIRPNKNRPLFLSLDIDGFCASLAPGCSASWPGGLEWQEVLPAWRWLLTSFQAKAMGIYEVSPPLDLNNQTSRLAARMIFETLRILLPKKPALARPRKK